MIYIAPKSQRESGSIGKAVRGRRDRLKVVSDWKYCPQKASEWRKCLRLSSTVGYGQTQRRLLYTTILETNTVRFAPVEKSTDDESWQFCRLCFGALSNAAASTKGDVLAHASGDGNETLRLRCVAGVDFLIVVDGGHHFVVRGQWTTVSPAGSLQLRSVIEQGLPARSLT